MADSLDDLTGHRPVTPLRSMHATNAYHAKNSVYLSEGVKKSMRGHLDFPKPRKSDPDYLWRSHATTFARGGIVDGKGKHYNRCAATGTWFLDEPMRRREYHFSNSDLTMRFTESKCHKPSQHVQTVWPAPCAGNFWRNRTVDPSKSMVLMTHNTVGLLAEPRSMSSPNLHGSM